MELQELSNRLDEFTSKDISKREGTVVYHLVQEKFLEKVDKHPEWDAQKIKDEFWKIANKEDVSFGKVSRKLFEIKLAKAGNSIFKVLEVITNAILDAHGEATVKLKKQYK